MAIYLVFSVCGREGNYAFDLGEVVYSSKQEEFNHSWSRRGVQRVYSQLKFQGPCNFKMGGLPKACVEGGYTWAGFCLNASVRSISCYQFLLRTLST